MLNVNEKREYMEEAEMIDNCERETQTEFEYYNSNCNVNFFGVGRGSEEL